MGSSHIGLYKRKEFSIALQRSDSKLLHSVIVRRIATELPKSLVYTIHDSVLVDSDHFDEVYNIVTEEIKKFFGSEAGFKVEGINCTPVPVFTPPITTARHNTPKTPNHDVAPMQEYEDRAWLELTQKMYGLRGNAIDTI